MLRSVLAVLAGIVTLTVASFVVELVANPLLMRAFPHALPDVAAMRANPYTRAFMWVYGFACVALGGYVAAWIARRFPVRHAAVLGVVQGGLTLLAMFSPEGNHASRAEWIMIALMSVPAAVVGGMLCKRRRPNDI